ncbi:hypothetical protein [Thermobifida fusca]|uniref:hypothetical protein n=1 Tax=Thermobifida fusca TaxID=2021 RepID=UPI00187816D4|nr:hypothetical protein [Thermobifida fusca]QOS58627.1 hypothetical protein IM867_14970 [Thermobifida fusca]
MSRYRPARASQRRRYQSLMKNWRRLSQADPDQAQKCRRQRRRLLEELRVLDLETYDVG